MDGTPFTPSSFARFDGNIFAYNDTGATLLSAVKGVEFSDNTFWENVEQVALQGGGKAGENRWQGNYWSDYTGFDVDGDGRGEAPYQADRYFESLTDREPLLRALLFSPAAQTIEFAATSFPVFKPQPKLSDVTPGTVPAVPPRLVSSTEQQVNAWGMGLTGAGMLSLCTLIGVWIYWREVVKWQGAFNGARKRNGLGQHDEQRNPANIEPTNHPKYIHFQAL
jgi:nitrous oxidase accessory protein